MPHGKIYHPEYLRTMADSKKPENTHLFIETSVDWYFVDSSDNKKLLKSTDYGATQTTVETRTKKIARCFHDRDNSKIYFIDCEYDGTTSYVWSIDLSDDSITEIKSFPITDVFDIFKMGSDIHVSYFSTTYDLESEEIIPDGDVTTNWNSTAGTHSTEVDEAHAAPNTGDYIETIPHTNCVDTFTFTTIDLSGYDSGEIYAIEFHGYGITGATIGFVQVYGNKTGLEFVYLFAFNYLTYGSTWDSITKYGLSLNQADLDDLEISFKKGYSDFRSCKLATIYLTIYFYGNSQASLNIENLTDSSKHTQNMGVLGVRTYEMSQMSVISATECYFNWKWSDENILIYKYNKTAGTILEQKDCGANTDFPDSLAQRAIAYDDTDILSFIIKDTGDANKLKYCTYSIDDDDFTKGAEYNVILMLNRNSDSSNDPPFDVEKAFHSSEYKFYKISKTGSKGQLYLMGDLNNADTPPTNVIIAISDTYLITNGGKIYKYIDFMNG